MTSTDQTAGSSVRKRNPLRQAPAHLIRQMHEQDIEEVAEVWRLIGLHEGIQTIRSFMQVDPSGFAVAVSQETGNTVLTNPNFVPLSLCFADDGALKRLQSRSRPSSSLRPITHIAGEILGMCAGVFVDPSVAFIGLYAVRPEYQGLGIGIKIWQEIMDHIGDRNAGLYAVPEHLHTYRDLAGFSVQDSIRMIVYESDCLLTTEDLVKAIGNVFVTEITDHLMERVARYDQSVAQVDRSHLLRLTFHQKDTFSLVAFETNRSRLGSESETNEVRKVIGYLSFRLNNIGKAMLGPLYADNDAVAELLVYQMIQKFPIACSKGLLYMTLDSSPGGIRIAEKLKLDYSEHLPRLFTKSIPVADFNRIYCIFSPNFSPF